MTRWYLIAGVGDRGESRSYKVRAESAEAARAAAVNAGMDKSAAVLDEAAVMRLSRYGYGLSLLFQAAPELPAPAATAKAA